MYSARHNHVDAQRFNADEQAMFHYGRLDDNDIWSAMKVWMDSDDRILAILATDLINRNIFQVEVSEEPISEERIDQLQEDIAYKAGIPKADAHYLMSVNTVQKDMYNIDDDHIDILYKDGIVRDIAEASEILNVSLLSKKICKYYLCYQRF